MTGLSGEYGALIRSDRVSDETRAALLARAAPDDGHYAPRTLDPAAYATLRAVLARVLPQDRVDLAQRLDTALADPVDDGWRFAILPSDADACRDACAALAGFEGLDVAAQDAALDAIAAGERGPMLDKWFEDLRGRATMIYVSHPSTFARMGYSGIAYGGADPASQGFHALGAGEREPWEPVGVGDAA